MKKLFEFTITKEITELEKESSVNEKGETVTVEKVVKKQVPKKITLKKPGRSLYDEAELFYGVRLSEGIKAGLLTRQLLAKRFSNDGGILSESDKSRYAELYFKLYETQNKAEKISVKKEDERTAEEKAEHERLFKESALIKEDLVQFEMGQASLFEQTAENRARNKTILWWLLNLSFVDNEEGEPQPVFGSGTFEERVAKYDELEESEDKFDENLLKKLLYYVSFWYIGKAQNEEDFKGLLGVADDK